MGVRNGVVVSTARDFVLAGLQPVEMMSLLEILLTTWYHLHDSEHEVAIHGG